MNRFVQGTDCTQCISLPAQLENFVSDGSPVRVAYVFIDSLDLGSLGFDGTHIVIGRKPLGKKAKSFRHRN